MTTVLETTANPSLPSNVSATQDIPLSHIQALDAKAAIFRSERRLLPALAAILIPASVLSKKSAMLSRPASELISLWFREDVQCIGRRSHPGTERGGPRAARFRASASQPARSPRARPVSLLGRGSPPPAASGDLLCKG
jgi:hypothetical protein